ncbi:NAD-dependent epimerase/dehydratase [Hyphomicrobium denitrificans 1NES1]|uniref:NAD-dependent epimerase/dehydratase n=1 Tax=Hyphomicrobium denitrificans 1NES1 TaxID=670307 RepID=N0B085_9HYPH|nr:NAD-dependent epimerase/dehydratase family protein [Hyphomicrobium denitrificans]AGK56313.1 NAD-dependent epimerase/dehydratase [Hyphomicrobium denitrificans 1NES1]
MKLLVTGADGFIGKNLLLALKPRADIICLPVTRSSSDADLAAAVAQADAVVHLAGINRPQDGQSYNDNVVITQNLVSLLRGRSVPIVYTSSAQVARGNDYGKSKLGAEEVLAATGCPLYLYRLPNVFGKFARPNYNSAVATFCHNIARGLPITIHDPGAALTLVYIDDVIASFLAALDGTVAPGFVETDPIYTTTVGELAEQIEAFRNCRGSQLLIERVGTGLTRALYATYVSALPPSAFSYAVTEHSDPRGKFVEMLKTPDCGQFSFFTAHPGVTRGGHYHHTKSEKFLVISGRARFGFRHMVTGERHEIETSGERSEVVETVPGWTHDITNIGDTELVVMLWANEIFDRDKADTYAEAV